MSYTPTNWQTGDTITAEKLNKLENGVADNGNNESPILVAHATDYGYAKILDKTWIEIHNSFINGGYAFIIETEYNSLQDIYDIHVFLINSVYYNSYMDIYEITMMNESKTYQAQTSNDFPSYSTTD